VTLAYCNLAICRRSFFALKIYDRVELSAFNKAQTHRVYMEFERWTKKERKKDEGHTLL
jgi:hypothetical protein